MCACADVLNFKYSDLKMFLLKLESELQNLIKKFPSLLKIKKNVDFISTKRNISTKWNVRMALIWQRYCEMAVFACIDIPYFRLRGDTIFRRKFLNIAKVLQENHQPFWRY